MPTLRKTVATPKTDSPTNQRNTVRTAARRRRSRREVERGVHERVRIGVLLAPHVREIDVLVLGEQRPRFGVQRPEVGLAYLPAPGELLDHQHRVGTEPQGAGTERPRRLQA